MKKTLDKYAVCDYDILVLFLNRRDELWQCTYARCAGMSMIPVTVPPSAELKRGPILKICPRALSAHFVVPRRRILKRQMSLRATENAQKNKSEREIA